MGRNNAAAPLLAKLLYDTLSTLSTIHGICPTKDFINQKIYQFRFTRRIDNLSNPKQFRIKCRDSLRGAVHDPHRGHDLRTATAHGFGTHIAPRPRQNHIDTNGAHKRALPRHIRAGKDHNAILHLKIIAYPILIGQ